jgi:hypothetical protein
MLLFLTTTFHCLLAGFSVEWRQECGEQRLTLYRTAAPGNGQDH